MDDSQKNRYTVGEACDGYLVVVTGCRKNSRHLERKLAMPMTIAFICALLLVLLIIGRLVQAHHAESPVLVRTDDVERMRRRR